MPTYKAPLRDMQFALNEVLGFEQHYQNLPGAEDASPDMVAAILEEAARFSEQVVSPLNPVGDREGCQWNEGEGKVKFYGVLDFALKAEVRIGPMHHDHIVLSPDDVMTCLLVLFAWMQCFRIYLT